MAITYNSFANCTTIFRATSGGTVFSANLAGTTFDYFTDTAVLNDAIYFFSDGTYKAISDLTVTVGTAMAGVGITITWEYYRGSTNTWVPIYNLVDNTAGFTATGARTVQFPIQPNMTFPSAGINGVTNTTAIRARISAITSITEGGANSTTTPRVGDGILYITGYSDATPCTFTELDTWINANRPDIESTKKGQVFTINNAPINVASGSTLRSTNEKIFNGNGAMVGPRGANLTGIHFGTKVGDDGWKEHTDFYNCWKAPGERYTIAPTNTFRCYGGTHAPFTNEVNGVTCTPSGFSSQTRGEWVGVLILNGGYFGSATMNRCTFDGSLILSTTVGTWPLNSQISDPQSRIFRFYSRTQNVPSFNYSMPIVSIMDYPSMGGNADADVTFTDFNPILPSQTGGPPRVVGRITGTPNTISNWFFYDSTAGTFTNYTTEATNTTADDVPIGGEVGDIHYIRTATTAPGTSQVALEITLTEQSNDYEYKLEHSIAGGAWKELPFNSTYDSTNNFTKSGYIYMLTNAITNPPATATVNGATGAWYRFTITKKGTGTPTISRCRFNAQNGITTGIVYEKYTYNLNVKDTDGNDIENARVRIKDLINNEHCNVLTNANGDIAEQYLTRKETIFDAQSSDADFNMKDVFKTPHEVTIRKYGFRESVFSKLSAGKSADSAKITLNPYIVLTKEEAEAITGISITDNTITINEDRTMQEVYDWCEWWAENNINKHEPYTTADGQTYFSDFDLVLDGCTLSGIGKISMVVNTVTYLNDATSEIDIIAVDGTHTNIRLTNIVSGSRVQLFDIEEGTELFNDIVDTSLTYPIIWNTDKNIRIRIMYIDGCCAKKWYETEAELTASGINLRVRQEDDIVYNEIAIDGSTVEECSIEGTNLVISIDDEDAHTTGQRIYAFEVYWLSTEDGIRDQALYIDAIDSTRFVFEGGLKIKNVSESPLTIDNCNIYPNEGVAADVYDLTGNTIFLNSKIVVPFAYNVNGATEEQFNELISKTRVLDKKVDDTQSRVITLTE